MKKVAHDTLKFETSGKEIYAYGIILGLDPFEDRKTLDVHYGYDGVIVEKCYFSEEVNLTPREAVELADHMIGVWHTYRDLATSKLDNFLEAVNVAD